jgi:hypothetical protein
MRDDRGIRPERTGVGSDRIVQVLSLEYCTLREEILVRATARYQFVGLVTGATGLIAAGIGLSGYGTGTWILAGLAAAVIGVGLYGYFRMRSHVIAISAHVAQLESRLNALVPAEAGHASLLSWESDHQGTHLFSLALPIRPHRRRPQLTPAAASRGTVASTSADGSPMSPA